MTTQPSTAPATRTDLPPSDPKNASTGHLLGDLTDQIGRLVRNEMRLAQAEVKQKAKRLGIGAGLFGGAGVIAVLGLGALITAAILGLGYVMPGWLAGIIIGAFLFAVAGVLALAGKKDVEKGKPPLPLRTRLAILIAIEGQLNIDVERRMGTGHLRCDIDHFSR